MASPTLSLEVVQSTPLTVKFQVRELKLGDGYEQTATVGKTTGALVDYGITTGYIPLADSMSLLGQLLTWKGVQSFFWTPKLGVPPKLFVCQQWQVTLVTNQTRQVSGTFQEVVK